MTLKHVLKHFNKTEVQEDEKLVIQRTKSEESQNLEIFRFAQDDETKFHLKKSNVFSLLGRELERGVDFVVDTCSVNKKLPSPDATRHPLPREGNKVSCAEHTVRVFSPFTTHFSQLCTPHPSYGHPLPREGKNVSCAKHTVKNLFTYLPIHLFTSKKVAFTLAEVLITLAIIGVVAAMTLPTLIQNHQKQTYVNGLKKAISATLNMLKKMQADEEASSITATSIVQDGFGLCVAPPPCTPETICVIDCFGNESCSTSECPSNGNGCEDRYGNPSVFERLVPKYLKVVKICKGEECNIEYKTSCSINAGKYVCDSTKYTMASAPYYNYELHNVVGFYTADGMIYYFIAGDYKNLSISVDVNGNKGPNTYGRDLFRFGYCMSREGKLSSGNPGDCSYIDYYYNQFLSRIIENGWKMDY